MATKPGLALLAFVAAALFLGLATFDVALADIPLVTAGLFSMAIGFVVDHAP
jgi:hypothetical protein